MSKEERYDFVIVGGGPNGVTLAAYLAKCGASVCVLEERTEAGGAVENTEPIAGVHINPHAILMYGGAAPGFDQLELWKYGFRISRILQADPTGFAPGGRGHYRRVGTHHGKGHDGLRQAERFAQPATLHKGAAQGHILVPATPAGGGGNSGKRPLHAGIQEIPAGCVD